MINEEFKKTFDEYNSILSPIVSKMINDNYKYYQINEKIFWSFEYDSDLSIMGTCSRDKNEIHLNIFSVKKAFYEGLLIDVEYFIVHEIRHIFQHIEIRKYKAGIESAVDTNLIKKWIYENEHYEKALDENGNENPEYFKQDSEFDAYAFSYALMKYKYKNVSKLYVPNYYGKEFYETVDYWIDIFKTY